MKNDETEALVQEMDRTMTQFRRIGGQVRSSHAIRPSEFTLLHNIILCTETDPRGIKVSDLSFQLQITPAGVTHIINSLEERGYLERLAEPTDRRVVLVRATQKGKEIIEAMRSDHFCFLKGLTDYLGEHDSKELIRILSSVLNYLKNRGTDY
ncbi:transcriptional regulator [Desulfosporosinus acidiphilus SJ4]|uniref:Transcriptional regulator n=1 Tax=Desulfosporosinus acidiphilus (strain DSM 22704 / JCM 16185 / SJ4) TaxID=646529 RepID=I4DCI5_DESAJ|nr:MarR family transcriptional regulator [Desulfosporosinus acidiphilus]AFM43509.1 transcriptional regulator [Desulfosporosinus acidiphilus SJ4]